MDHELKTIVGRLTHELQAWLDKPGPADAKIERVRAELAGLKTELGTGVLGSAMKDLEKASTEARRGRQRQAAEAIAELCRPLGVVVEAKEPPKRKPRSTKGKAGPKAKAAPATASPDAGGGSPEGQ
jgi:hypothetical protein